MAQLRKHDPILHKRLQQFLNDGDAVTLGSFLQNLNVAQFRTAGYMLALPDGLSSLSSDEYWKFFLTIVPLNSKAYLGTFLKSGAQKLHDKSLILDFDTLREFSNNATVIDKRKILTAFLPYMQEPDEVGKLLQILSVHELDGYIQLLTSIDNAACYYTLFKAFKQYDATPLQLRRACILLMRQQTPAAFRFAVIIKEYFDIGDLPGTFSLRVEPWKLNRLDASYNNFRRLVTSY